MAGSVVSPEDAQATLRNLKPGSRIHMIGVAGAGMNALAAILLARGYQLSGSDLQRTSPVHQLVLRGLAFEQGHNASNVAGADLVIISAAVGPTNVELAAAKVAGIPIMKRAVALGWLLEDRRTVAVAGTHGKTTTSAMVAVALARAGMDPTFVIGSEVLDLGASAATGTGEWAVVEADEYDRSFLQLRPEIAVITNVEPDHLEYYGSVEAMHAAYEAFVAQIRPGGALVLNAEDSYLRGLSVRRDVAVVFCGLQGADAAWRAEEIQEDGKGSVFCLVHPGGDIRSRLAVSGRHNVSNALQAIAAAETVGVDPAVAAGALATFRGTSRRFQVVGEAEGVLVIDDYAHHPTEIRATLTATRARFPGRRVVAIFQPHTYSRTKLLFDDFMAAFDDAEIVVLTEIYASRETDTLGITSNMLGNALATRLGADRVSVVGEWAKITTEVAPILRANDLVLTLGAGTITEVGLRLLEALNARSLRYRA